MKRTKGFTLIELLVVIAIIALLLSVLLPSLRRAKEQAKTMICQSRLKQWGTIIPLYATDNGDTFPALKAPGMTVDEVRKYIANGQWWIVPYRPYYSDPAIRLCPQASLAPPNRNFDYVRKLTEAWAAPNRIPELESGVILADGTNVILGSLAPNAWLAKTFVGGWFGNDDRMWGKLTNVKQPFSVPAFMDCYWVDGWPDRYNTGGNPDVPQEDYENIDTWDVNTNPMQRFNVIRHAGRVNGVFVDGSVKKVALKQLWGLKWHPDYNVGNTYTQPNAPWPEWMRGLPE